MRGHGRGVSGRLKCDSVTAGQDQKHEKLDAVGCDATSPFSRVSSLTRTRGHAQTQSPRVGPSVVSFNSNQSSFSAAAQVSATVPSAGMRTAMRPAPVWIARRCLGKLVTQPGFRAARSRAPRVLAFVSNDLPFGRFRVVAVKNENARHAAEPPRCHASRAPLCNHELLPREHHLPVSQ